MKRLEKEIMSVSVGAMFVAAIVFMTFGLYRYGVGGLLQSRSDFGVIFGVFIALIGAPLTAFTAVSLYRVWKQFFK